ncbi:MAG: sulfur carrier protein ThiS [Peptoniphilus sp.]|nr:sulfur carrier protein ThiS [Peptoniphilus sp.]MDD7363049.1 sulfur carrier protein ThiS [Bacillota bacterium]MDY6045314.1 sulfur carrier protein ThiS [Peptoniphilus sp.]
MRINDRDVKIDGKKDLRSVLIDAGFDPEAVALEKNRELVRRADIDTTYVTDDDVLEVFSFTGGG